MDWATLPLGHDIQQFKMTGPKQLFNKAQNPTLDHPYLAYTPNKFGQHYMTCEYYRYDTSPKHQFRA